MFWLKGKQRKLPAEAWCLADCFLQTALPPGFLTQAGKKNRVCKADNNEVAALFPGAYVEFTHSERLTEGLFAGCVITHSDCIVDFQYQGLI